MGTSQDAELLEGRVPLIFKDARIVPAGGTTFAKTDALMVYGEVYEPLLKATPLPVVELHMQVTDRKTKGVKSTGSMQPVITPPVSSTTLPFRAETENRFAGQFPAPIAWMWRR